MTVLRNSPEKILSLIGVGTALSLAYSAFNYAVQITLVELFGYHFRGIFEILMSIIGLISIIFSFNFYTTINLYVSKNQAMPENLKKISLSILAAQVAATGVFYLITTKKEIIANDYHAIFIAITIAAIVLNHKINEFTAILNGHHYFIAAKLLNLYGSIFSATTIGLIYFFGLKDENLIACFAVLGPFAGSYIYHLYITKTIKNVTQKKGLLSIKNLYIESRAVYIISLAQFISIKLYLLYIAHSESIELLGIFSLAYSITQFILLPATFLATIILSNRIDSLGVFLKSLKVLVGYGVASSICLKIAINFGLLQTLHLRSLQNPIFIAIFDIIIISVPFSILNILMVAVAVRKNMCSKSFVFVQISLIPLIIIFYYIIRKILALEVAVAVSGSYVLTSVLSSILTFLVLQISLQRSRKFK